MKKLKKMQTIENQTPLTNRICVIDTIMNDDERETKRKQFKESKVEAIKEPQIVPRRYDDVADDDDAANDEANRHETSQQQHLEQHGRRLVRLQPAPKHQTVCDKPNCQQHIETDVERHH